MTRKEKNEKKQVIREHIDLGRGHYTDNEVDELYAIVTNPGAYDGKSFSRTNSFTDWCSDGKYTRNERTTFTLHCDDADMYVEKSYSYHDDDGTNGGYTEKIREPRNILSFFGL